MESEKTHLGQEKRDLEVEKHSIRQELIRVEQEKVDLDTEKITLDQNLSLYEQTRESLEKELLVSNRERAELTEALNQVRVCQRVVRPDWFVMINLKN